MLCIACWISRISWTLQWHAVKGLGWGVNQYVRDAASETLLLGRRFCNKIEQANIVLGRSSMLWPSHRQGPRNPEMQKFRNSEIQCRGARRCGGGPWPCEVHRIEFLNFWIFIPMGVFKAPQSTTGQEGKMARSPGEFLRPGNARLGKKAIWQYPQGSF